MKRKLVRQFNEFELAPAQMDTYDSVTKVFLNDSFYNVFVYKTYQALKLINDSVYIVARSKNGDMSIEIVEYSDNLSKFSSVVCTLICFSLKYHFNEVTDSISLNPGSQIKVTLLPKIMDYKKFCNCESMLNVPNQKNQIRLKIRKLENLENIRPMVHEIWSQLYYFYAKNKYFDLNFFLYSLLNKYVNILLKKQNCNIARIIFDIDTKKIHGPSPETIKYRTDHCKKEKSVINVSIETQGSQVNHSNTFVIENGEVWKFEPNVVYRLEELVDETFKDYFESVGLKYRGRHEQSCGIDYHGGLCIFIASFSILYGSKLTKPLLKQSIIDFFRWAVEIL